MTGRYVTLTPLLPSHAEALHAAADDSVWTYLGYGPFDSAAAYRDWVEANATTDDPLFFAVLVEGEPSGVVSYLRHDPANGVTEIGHIWYAPSIQRTRATTEAAYLLCRRVFDDLGYRRLEWKCHALNQPSRDAAARFGFAYEGVFRNHYVVKGRNRDTAWFGMTDGDWPAVKAAFEAWLDPANFDEDRRQRRSLTELGAGSRQAATRGSGSSGR
jgi:RimJ/RimL family protein N-acetyltransferase